MTGRNGGRKPEQASPKARELERKAKAHGAKPLAKIEDDARLTPVDGEELLAAILELRTNGACPHVPRR